MNGRERILASIDGKERNQIALWPFVMAFSAKYAGVSYREFATDYKMLAKAQIMTADAFGLDAVTVDSDAYREAAAFGAVLDFPEDDLPIMKKAAIPDKTKFQFKKPDIYSCQRLMDKIEGIRCLKEHYKGEKAVVGWIEAPLQSTGLLYNLDDFMMDLFEEDSFVMELLELVTEFEIEFALEQARAGADIIAIGDAMASLVSPIVYKERIFPFIKKVVDGIHRESDAKVKYHICGNAAHLLQYVEEIGFDIINIDYKIDIKEAFRLTNNKVGIKGNINPVAVLKDGTKEQIRCEAEKLLALNNPRFILSAGCEVPRDTPVENFKALCEMVNKR